MAKIRKKGKLVDAPEKFKEKEKRKPRVNRLSPKDPAREELRQKQLKEDPEFAADVKEKAREEEIKNIAQKSVDIEKQKKVITEEETTAIIETPTLTKVKTEEATTIETETIIQTDDAGFQTEIQMPIGTMDKINAAKARREGRVPFNELPAYQQFLAGAAVTSVSPSVLTKGGKFINSGTKQLSKFMKTNLGKYVGKVEGFGAIMVWLASDNLVSTMSIYGRDLAEDVQWGRIDSESALRKFDDGVAFIEIGKNFIKTATIIFPLLWGFRSIILTNIEASDLAMEENRNRILKGGN